MKNHVKKILNFFIQSSTSRENAQKWTLSVQTVQKTPIILKNPLHMHRYHRFSLHMPENQST